MNTGGKRVAIVGGGAAGLIAAVAAGERARATGRALDIAVYERDERVGRTILATGNGRCNFSNARIVFSEYYNHEFAGEVIGRGGGYTDDDDVHRFFEEHGLVWREEEDGRQYPLANKASVVVDVLRASAAAAGAREACGREVAAIEPPRGEGKPFTLRMADGVLERAEAVVVACGGRAASSLDAQGLRFLRTRPVLGPLRVADDDIPFVRELDNIRVRCTASLFRPQGEELAHIATRAGELMFRKYGVSGICVFDLSRFAWPGDVLNINFLPDYDRSTIDGFLAKRHEMLERRFGEGVAYHDLLRGLLLPRVTDALLKAAKLDARAACDEAGMALLGSLLSGYALEIRGIGDADLCQVRRGGFDVEQFDPATMTARDLPGLFAAGEALDVDGPCGGYNLHWAWATGLLAGRSAAEFLE